MEPIRIEAAIPARIDRVWSAWTRPDRITSWFAPEARLEARVGGAFELFFDPADHEHQCTKGCAFTTFEPKKRLGFTWRGPDRFERLMNNSASLTSVLVTFSNEDGITRVLVEHHGWGTGAEWEKARAWHQKAWEEVLGSLSCFLESKAEGLEETPD